MKRMKSVVAVMMTGFLVLALMIPAEAAESGDEIKRKEINLFGAFGVASFFFDEGLLDLGLELQATGGLYFSFVINNRLGGDRYWNPYDYGYGYGYGWYRTGIGIYVNSLYGFNFFCTLKLPLSASGKVKLFAKGGVFYMLSSGLEDSEASYSHSNTNENGLGGALGSGMEYRIADRVSLVGGVTYKKLFKQELLDRDTQEIGSSWFKYYLGIAYRLK